MEAIYQFGEASASEVAERIADAPSYSAVRALLRVLEDKGYLRHRQDGPRYIYLPMVPRERAVRSALDHVRRTFFEGSTEGVVATLLEMEASRLSPEELDKLATMIDEARKEGR